MFKMDDEDVSIEIKNLKLRHLILITTHGMVLRMRLQFRDISQAFFKQGHFLSICELKSRSGLMSFDLNLTLFKIVHYLKYY